MKRKTKVVIFLYVLAFVSLAAVIYVVPSVTGALTPTELLTYGNLTDYDREICYFVRDEQVSLASTDGTINYYFEEGVKIRKNTIVLSMTPHSASRDEDEKSPFAQIVTRLGSDAVVSADYRSEVNGVVSYSVDGYEAYFTPERIRELDYEEVKDLPIDKPVNLTREAALRGEPLYKICKNDKWYATCWVSDGNSVKYQTGNSVRLRLPLGEVKATVTDVIDRGDVWQIIFETDRYYEDFTSVRTAEIDIVTSDYSGILVPNRSIATVEGQVGVYVKQKTGDYKFTPIRIIASDGESSAVESSYFYDEDGKQVSSVEIYDEILKNPE